MIILDTNVVSEMVRGPRADARVLGWIRRLDQQPVTTVLNRAELLAGVALLPAGRRRDQLSESISRILSDLRVCLPFTADCPAAYAEIVAARSAAGRPIGAMDALIASVAVVNTASIATRDVEGFLGLGLDLMDPWAGSHG